jgi:hypothetical protein
MTQVAEKKYVRQVDAKTLVNQIGMMNVLAISGGRVIDRGTGITLPVGHGYGVEIDLNFMDFYDVKRVYTRGGKRVIKGEAVDVDCFEIGEVAYKASCYVNVSFGEDKK